LAQAGVNGVIVAQTKGASPVIMEVVTNAILIAPLWAGTAAKQ